jgi:cellulose synthase/poly-beta-1,6-N-acetylglucosamine synthase-like glycosyltransferase
MIDSVLTVTALVLLIPALTLFTEVTAALFKKEPEKSSWFLEEIDSVSFIVLVPAHNEETVISKTLDSLLKHVTSDKQILVVADNCTDATAVIAREKGFTVLERFDPSKRGKGYALAYGIRHLVTAPPDVLIIFDADCEIKSGTLSALSGFAHYKQQPVQAKYLMEVPDTSVISNRIAALAFRFKNYIRPLGLKKLGLPCLLTGTGMAIPWKLAEQVNFETGNIVEDMQIGLDFEITGHSPLFFEDVTVVSEFPDDAVASRSQRTRWEHGHLQTIFSQVPILLKEAVKQWRFSLIMLAMDIAIPPLSFFALLLTGFLVTAVGAVLFGGPAYIVALGIVPIFVLTLSILLGWTKFGRDVMPAKMLLAIPLFVLWKIPVYFKFFLNPEKEWVRTNRKKRK